MLIEPVAGASAESGASAVSWPAVIGGAMVASVVTLMLTILGSAIGLGSMSALSMGANPSAGKFTALAAIWLIIVQWLSSGLGGYLTGRLRTKWAGVHTHEVFFRDTANGFLSWALASLLVVGLLSSSLASVVSGATHAGATVAAGASQGATSMGASAGDQRGTMIDTLLRPATPNPAGSPQDSRGEVGRILASGADGTMSPDDKTYLSQLIAVRAGISQPDAEKRIDDAMAKEQAATQKAKQAAEATRKATSKFLLFTFVSMLIGAFIACAAAALGGRERDGI